MTSPSACLSATGSRIKHSTSSRRTTSSHTTIARARASRTLADSAAGRPSLTSSERDITGATRRGLSHRTRLTLVCLTSVSFSPCFQFSSYDPRVLRSHVEFRSDLLTGPVAVSGSARSAAATKDPLASIPLTDYFGAVTPLRPSDVAYELADAGNEIDDDNAAPHVARRSSATDMRPAPSSPPDAPTLPLSAVMAVALLVSLVLIDLNRIDDGGSKPHSS